MEDKERGKFINLVLRYMCMYIIGGKEKNNFFNSFFIAYILALSPM